MNFCVLRNWNSIWTYPISISNDIKNTSGGILKILELLLQFALDNDFALCYVFAYLLQFSQNFSNTWFIVPKEVFTCLYCIAVVTGQQVAGIPNTCHVLPSDI